MNKVLLMGLPGSGKTTFLAALWAILDFQEVKTKLTLDSFDADNTYLNHIRSSWLQCQSLARTSETNGALISLTLRDAENDKFQVYIPDIKGEEFDEQWISRYCSKEHHQNTQEMNGLMLFIHPGKVIPHVTIFEANEIFSAVELNNEQVIESEGKVELETKKEIQVEEKALPFSPVDCPTQVKLVDNLQVIINHTTRSKINLAIAISAWDLVTDVTPEEWLKDNLPLLDQFLRSNNLFVSKCFGVSAQGGELSESERLLKISNPSERIKVVTDKGIIHDLTEVLDWARRD